MKELSQGVAVVTGGASGIGYAMAERFAREGMHVVLADIEATALQAAQDRLKQTGADVLAVQTDVAQADSVEALAAAVFERHGKATVLCNNAGVQRSGPAWDLTLAEWKWIVDVNLWGVVHGVRSFVPRMLEQKSPAHIVNTASFGGLIAAPMMSAYNVAKFGVVALSESLSAELMGSNVAVSVLCPAFVKTNLGDADRNSPAGLNEGAAPDVLERRKNVAMAARALIDSGIDATIVAECVVDGILNERLHIITHPEAMGAFKRRADEILRAGRQAEQIRERLGT